MEEEINDMEASVLYEAMHNSWRNEKEIKELETAKRKKRYVYFLSWMLGINTIEFINLEPTEII